jgi:hypothetical protein
MLVLLLVFIAALILVLFFILVPLYGFSRQALKASPDLKELGYFICLGLGFMLIEMTLVQKFILFLGQPVYALSIVLFSTLLFSGVGSLFSARLWKHSSSKGIQPVCWLVALLVVAYLLALPHFLYRFVAWPILPKALLVVALLIPLSFVLGMPLPLGIRKLNESSPWLIPWAWGMNGSASVLGSILTILIAVSCGFNQALLLAIGLYFLAPLFLWRSTTIQ